MAKFTANSFVVVVLCIVTISCSGTTSDPYRRIVVAHRAAQVGYEGMLKKSVKWEEPLKSAVLREFSEENITVIIIEILKDYLTEEEAKSLADFLESYEGQKLVAYAYGEYDLTKMPETEWKKMERFMKTKAGVAFNNFADLGMEKYHQTLRERTKKLVDSHRK